MPSGETKLRIRQPLAGLAALFLAACSPGETGTTPAPKTGTQVPVFGTQASYEQWFEPGTVALGERVYQANCATCHGADGEGAPNWTEPGPDGRYPPPPLNGTGHAWHHPLRMLMQVVRNGSPGGKGNMPAWKEKLSDEEILAAIAWFQSKWPQELYDNWAQRDLAQRGNSG